MWLQICLKKSASTAQEDHPQDFPQQAAHRKGDKSEVIDIIRGMQADRQHEKTKDNHWREREEVCLEREEECRRMEYLQEQECKAREEECKEQDHLFSQWECIQMNIQQLSAALSTETNDLLKHDIQSDVIALINRKNAC